MEGPRETQFATFAKLVVEDLRIHGAFPMRPVVRSEARPLIEEIIAKHAYALTEHTVGYALEYLHECGLRTPGSMNLSILPSIPDMTALPEVSE